MADAKEMKCPICRARQTCQPKCRRCGADLRLYIKALHSVDITQQRMLTAQQAGNSELADRLLTYMAWLQPAAARRFERTMAN